MLFFLSFRDFNKTQELQPTVPVWDFKVVSTGKPFIKYDGIKLALKAFTVL